MKKFKRLLVVVSIVATMLAMQVAPAFASVDGGLWMTSTSTPMKASNSGGAATIMNLGQYEAISHLGPSTGGYEYYMGRSASMGQVSGYVLDNSVQQVYGLYNRYALTIYTDESETASFGDMGASSMPNFDDGWQQTHKQMTLLNMNMYRRGTDGVNIYFNTVFVHTNFESGSPSLYYFYDMH